MIRLKRAPPSEIELRELAESHPGGFACGYIHREKTRNIATYLRACAISLLSRTLDISWLLEFSRNFLT